MIKMEVLAAEIPSCGEPVLAWHMKPKGVQDAKQDLYHLQKPAPLAAKKLSRFSDRPRDGIVDCGPPFSRLFDNNSRLAICDSNVSSRLKKKAVSVKR